MLPTISLVHDKPRIEHLKALSGCNNPLSSADELLSIELLTKIFNIIKNVQLSPLILVEFRDSHISALSKRFIQEDLRLSVRYFIPWFKIITHSIRSIMVSSSLMELILLIVQVALRLFYILKKRFERLAVFPIKYMILPREKSSSSPVLKKLWI